MNRLPIPGVTQESSVAYIPVYYPGTREPTQATPLSLSPGGETRADFTLSPATGATVLVKYKAPPGITGLLSLIADGLGGTQSFQRQEKLMGGTGLQHISGVPPGRYVVRVAGTVGTSDFSARQIVEVNGTAVNVDLTLT